MSLDDMIRGDATFAAAEFGEDVEYQPAGGQAVTIRAIVDRQVTSAQREDRGRTLGRPVSIRVLAASVPSPTTGDKVKLSIDGVAAAVWLPITAILPAGGAGSVYHRDPGMHHLAVGR